MHQLERSDHVLNPDEVALPQAACVDHLHPQRAEEFAKMPASAEEQAHVAIGNPRKAFEGAGATFGDVTQCEIDGIVVVQE